ncbi:hypothetical protein C4553_01090 [Candidatus Parcubacteria bacterium]|nr:MAG: hypothetical protein C4553_01090 [Candidatus Parcubacteria bacterium]
MSTSDLSAFKSKKEPEIEKGEKLGVFKKPGKPERLKKTGRPPKEAEEKHNKAITVYFTASDQEKLKKLSQKRFDQPLAKLIYDQLKESGVI